MRTDTKHFHVTPSDRFPIDSDEIGRRAYEIWESEGRPEGKEKQHWFQAAEELAKARATDDRRTEAVAPPSAATESSESSDADEAGSKPLILREEEARIAGTTKPPSKPSRSKPPVIEMQRTSRR
ncbi:MAG: DUF2934 domain-containing protein [Opitutaceae bacterium]